MGKKIAVSLSIILICCITFINGYTFVYPSYADSTTDEWTSVTTNEELAQAFEYYCKSRNLFIDGSILGSATKFTTQSFDNICNTLGINMSALQADLKKSTDKNGGLQFLFNTSGISAYNRIFAEFLQNHSLEVGQEYDDDVIYSRLFYNGCFVYKVDGTGQGPNKILERGSAFQGLNGNLLLNNGNSVYVVNPFVDEISFNTVITNNGAHLRCNIKYDGTSFVIYDKDIWNGADEIKQIGDISYFIINNNPSTLYFGVVTTGYNNAFDFVGIMQTKYDQNLPTANIVVNTNNTTINNNTYNDNRQTVINNQGDVNNYDYDDDDPPVNPPPSTVTPPSNSGGSDGDVSFPNFNFQLPEINWSLGDLSEKFPFSIPFDLIAFFTVLNAEPQAPSIDANIPLGSWYTWHFQADFSQFDNWATIIRNVEFIAFCIGLIYLTIRLVKG